METISRDEAAQRLGIDVSRVTRLYDAGILKGERIGEGRRCILRITVESVNERLANPGKPGRKHK